MPQCPKCGSRDITVRSDPSRNEMVVLCRTCRTEWDLEGKEIR